MNDLTLIHCRERFYENIWGGRRLESVLGKDAPAGKPVGEAWLISDHAGDESVVDEGVHSGKTLRQLLEEDSRAILGNRAELTIHGRFPLLLKLLDSDDRLSVQVHPDDECAKRLDEPDVGKTEMWHVLDAEPGSELICGLDQSVTGEQFSGAVHDGSVEQLMTQFEATAGTSVFVSAGTVHAIGGGITLAEIQQNSDLTYRIYDWGRVQDDGTPRELHVDKAVEAIHFGSPHGGATRPLERETDGARVEVLAACRYFAAESVEIDGMYTRATRGDSFHIVLAKTDGVAVTSRKELRALRRGEAVLIPGAVDRFSMEGAGVFLEYYVPDLGQDIIAPLADAGHPTDDIVRLGGDPAHSDLRG